MLHWIQHSSLCTTQIQLCVVSAERGVWRGGHGSDGSSSFAEEHGGRVEALALLLQFTFHLTAPDNSPGCPGLSHALTLLSHALTFFLPGTFLSWNAPSKPSAWVSRCTSVQWKNSSWILLSTYSIFIIPKVFITSTSSVVVYFVLSTLSTDSSNVITSPSKTPRNLPFAPITTTKISLFRFSLAFYNSSFQSPVASASCIKSECHISIFRPFRAVLPLASLFLFSFHLSKGFCQTNSKPLCWTQTAGYRHLRAGKCLGEQMGLDELEEKGGFVLWAEEVKLGCWKRGHTWQLWVFLVFKHCGQVLTSGWSNIPYRALLLFLLVSVFLPEHSNCCHIFVWPHTFVQWCNMEKAKFKCLV